MIKILTSTPKGHTHWLNPIYLFIYLLNFLPGQDRGLIFAPVMSTSRARKPSRLEGKAMASTNIILTNFVQGVTFAGRHITKLLHFFEDVTSRVSWIWQFLKIFKILQMGIFKVFYSFSKFRRKKKIEKVIFLQSHQTKFFPSCQKYQSCLFLIKTLSHLLIEIYIFFMTLHKFLKLWRSRNFQNDFLGIQIFRWQQTKFFEELNFPGLNFTYFLQIGSKSAKIAKFNLSDV